MDLGHGATVKVAQRRKLQLLPRTKPLSVEKEEREQEAFKPKASLMSRDQAEKKIEQDLKEFFAIRNLEEGEEYFTVLPAEYHHLLVNRLVNYAIESKEGDAKLVGEFFRHTTECGLCVSAAFEEGFMPIAGVLDDIAIDVPKAFELMAIMMRGAKLEEGQRTRIASKSMDSDKLLSLLA